MVQRKYAFVLSVGVKQLVGVFQKHSRRESCNLRRVPAGCNATAEQHRSTVLLRNLV